jgi:hypothetical protein
MMSGADSASTGSKRNQRDSAKEESRVKRVERIGEGIYLSKHITVAQIQRHGRPRTGHE